LDGKESVVFKKIGEGGEGWYLISNWDKWGRGRGATFAGGSGIITD
jgi:hypothetical protein